ncbi:phosphatidylinositol n-acetylglucosaminyltransferase subunit c [Moniliophthora roreri MCA 2997]|uniref:Phosphatidylinositol n-acetylglucosaminyltransferase subunit c n=1 Tax=Moniliophthora roreri (strain MCA 2997) TaxID=1381753 RepID=V2X7X1_MONRO|nr:phosphatidylinositol n-acetylglucosaminyltransferase subunit c [Moniliophthora roreri MCA 2997]
MDTDTSEQWQKLLWRSQSFPDNYVPQGMFLSSLRRNLNFTPYDYKSLALLSCPITQHLAMTLVFLDVFIQLKDRSLDPRMLVLLTTTLFLVGYASWELILYFTSSDRRGNADRVKGLKSSILIFLALMSLSPVLRTLTAATSSDSIWALSAALFLVSLLLADYGPSKTVGHSQESLTSVLSINAAISSSVVLASRLSDDLGVFALILFSVQTFALFPFLRRRIQAVSTRLQVSLTAVLSIAALLLWSRRSVAIALLFACILVSVTLLAPMILLWAQKYKNEIRGPWDVAVPKVN